MTTRARTLGLSNVSFRIGDVEALPFADASLDAIVAAGLFCNLSDPSQTLGEFARVHRVGGQVVIVEFDRNSMTRAPRVFEHHDRGIQDRFKLFQEILVCRDVGYQ